MRFVKLCLFLLMVPSALYADPILIADYAPNLGEVRCNACTAPAVTSFDIWSGIPSVPIVRLFGNFSDGEHFGFQVDVGTTGTFDFTAANAPGFDPLVARLTDSINDHLVFEFTHVNSNDRCSEECAFGSLLTDHTVDFLRLIVNQNDIVSDAGGYTHTLDVEWQIWGDSTPLPVPGTLSLLGIGLSALVVARRRRT